MSSGREENWYGTSGMSSASQITGSTDACQALKQDTSGAGLYCVPVPVNIKRQRKREETHSRSFMELARVLVRKDSDILAELAKY